MKDSQGVRLHRPDWCMKGIGWKRTGVVQPGKILLEAGEMEGYWVEYQKPGARALQFWTLLRNGRAVEIHFDEPALVEGFSWEKIFFPAERSSSWEMISVVVSSSAITPEQSWIEKLMRNRITLMNADP